MVRRWPAFTLTFTLAVSREVLQPSVLATWEAEGKAEVNQP